MLSNFFFSDDIKIQSIVTRKEINETERCLKRWRFLQINLKQLSLLERKDFFLIIVFLCKMYYFVTKKFNRLLSMKI